MEAKKIFSNPYIRAALALLCCALWGSAFPCVKMGYDWLYITGTGSQILFAGYRFFLAGVLTFLIGCFIEKRILTMKRASIPYVIRQGVLQTTVQYFFFYIGMAYTTGAKGSVINAGNAFVAILVAPLLIKGEKMTWKKGIGCFIGFLGVLVVNMEPGAWGSGFSLQGEGMILLCTISYGISTVVMKMISHMESAITITSYQLLFGGALLIIIGFAAGGHITGFEGKSIILLIYMALLSSVAFTIWAQLLKYNAVGEVSIFGFSIPIFGVCLSALILGEQVVSMKNLAALICVSIGILIVNGLGGKGYWSRMRSK